MDSSPWSTLPGTATSRCFSIACFICTILLVYSTLPTSELPSLHIFSGPSQNVSAWQFDSERDRNAYSLTQEQCDSAFPLAYSEIARSVQYWSNGITPEAINITQRKIPSLRLLIHDQQLYILQAKGVFQPWADRMVSLLSQIHRSLITSPSPLPNVEFSISIKDDCPTPPSLQNAIFNFNRQKDNEHQDALWLIPAFNYWSWQGIVASYGPFQKMLVQTDTQPLQAKKQQAVWRGAVSVNPGLRDPLLAVTKDQEWADVQGVDWANKTDLNAKWISMADHCDYAFPVYTEGTTWSGRLKYLLNCRSATVIHTSEWITHIHHLLKDQGPEQNHISVARDWHDLKGKVRYYSEERDEAQAIADRAAATFRDRYITPAAEVCYWRRLFREYAKVAFQPALYEDENEKGVYDPRRQVVRGMPFEEWVLVPRDYRPLYGGEKDF
ncbi:Guanylate kinase [Sphaceloma murrayae]|uniref:Guanylate kinase n=1 Tax=Sphaceloma murrayae TaxID=2082308 RepID=A0A2K1QLA6_9PEZI|nr:Guanylate kinase [Sphaceloma murrayae]